jgi:hypothetical protein
MSHSGLFQSDSGYSQQGGAYYIVISSVVGQFKTYTPGSGSGGATTVGSFGAYNYAAAGPYDQSTVLGANSVIKDMGKTVVSAGRTFRKFQGVFPQTVSTSGVSGPAGSTTNPGYLSGYLEISKDGSGLDAAKIARYA